MSHSRAEVIAAIAARFPRDDVDRLVALVDTYGVAHDERERERVQLAMIDLSEGHEDKLRYFLSVAKQDYRDVLFWHDNPEEAIVDTPEKKRAINEAFAKLGLKPPIPE